MDLQNIAFAFENLEYIVVPAHKVKHIYMLDIQDNLTFNDGSTRVNQHKSAEHIFIQLKKSADDPSNQTEHHSKTFQLFDRLINQNDVCTIIVNMDTDSEKEINVYWAETADDYCNPSQTARIGPDGDLYFVVSSEKTVDDYLPEEFTPEIN